VPEKLDAIKKELAVLARRKRARDVRWSRDCPTEWQPEQVIDPRTGTYFTRNGAWDFIAEQLETEGKDIKPKVLDKPLGKKAYELIVGTKQGKIYIKVHFGNGGKIVGRSFHY